MRVAASGRRSEGGFALISTLLLLTLLLGIALPLGMLARLQQKAAAYDARRAPARALAWSALQLVAYQLPPANEPFAYPLPEELSEESLLPAEGRREGWWLESGEVVLPADGGFFVRVTDESGKIPLSWLQADTLAALPGMDAGKAAAIIDWVDADEEALPDGAELEAYQESGYAPRNAMPPTVAELALVAGIAPELLWGEDKNQNGLLDAGEDIDEDGMLAEGLADWVTPGADSTARININTAPPAVLAALPGSSAELAAEVVAYRTETPFTDVAQLRELSAYTADAAGLMDLLTVTGGALRLQITAWPATGRPVVRAEAFITRNSQGVPELTYWHCD